MFLFSYTHMNFLFTKHVFLFFEKKFAFPSFVNKISAENKQVVSLAAWSHFQVFIFYAA